MEEQKNAAKFAFFYLLSLFALLFMSLSVGMIIFQIINKNIVDVINQYSGRFSSEQLKFAISALIISAPIFFVTTWQIFKNLFTGALSKDSQIRKWLTYLVLFVSSVVMIVWLIMTINRFLDGELTIKAALKTLTVLVIAASIFSFYFYDIKREEVVGKKNKVIQISFYAVLVVVVAVFVSSLFIVESPTETRNRKLDETVLNSFNDINNALNDYYSLHKSLPTDLEALSSEFAYVGNEEISDPITKEKFEYRIAADTIYELCANFRTSNLGDENTAYRVTWPHDQGRQCFKKSLTRINENISPKVMPID